MRLRWISQAVRRALAGLALLAATLAFAPSASAQAEGATATVLFGAAPVGVMGTVFLVADIVYAAENRWLPREWAIAQIIGASLELAFGATALVGIAQGSRLSAPLAGFAAAGLAIGIWHLTHAILSLSAEEKPDEEPALSAGVLEGGGIVIIAGAF